MAGREESFVLAVLPRRVPFYLKFPGEEPVRMEEFARRNDPASAALPEFNAEG